MKKLLFILSVMFLFTGCTGPSVVDKVDEKGHNPAPEQIIDVSRCAQPADTIAVEANDSLSL